MRLVSFTMEKMEKEFEGCNAKQPKATYIKMGV